MAAFQSNQITLKGISLKTEEVFRSFEEPIIMDENKKVGALVKTNALFSLKPEENFHNKFTVLRHF